MNFFDFIVPIYEIILHFGTKKTLKTLNELILLDKTDKVLDLGGGTGRISKFFVGRVKEIIVLDSSQGMIKECRKYPGLNCIKCSAEKIPFPDDYFNKIIIVDAFHHFQHQEAVCKEIKRILKQGGILIIEEFNPETAIGKIIVLLEKLFKMNSNFYSSEELNEFFAKYLSRIKIFNGAKTRYYLIAGKI